MMSTRVPARPAVRTRIPPLENGDRLTRDEFERRYHAMPPDVKAELIEGVVYMASPARFESHGQADVRIITWLGVYQSATPGTDGSVNSTVRLSADSEPQPDSCLFVHPDFGGQIRISDDDYIERAPELVVEVAASSVSLDLGPKRRAYAQAGVREYIVWRTLDEAIDWFSVGEGAFVPIAPDAAGVIKSQVFPGLWLDVAAALRRDTAAILSTLQQGLQSSEHARFVTELQSRRAS
jgi:Uma2 family endonuclease